MVCKKCGAQVEDGVQNCPACGAAMNEPEVVVTNNNVDANDAEQNKAMGILAYIGILWLVPMLAAKNSPFARFHANQGLVLFICEAALSIIGTILGFIPYVGWIFSWLCSIACIPFIVLGIIAAAKGQMKELPIIGKFRILK